MWDFYKPTSKMSAEEIQLQETFLYVREIEERLRKIEFVLDELYSKALTSSSLLASNGLLVVRKINEDKLKELDKLID